MFIVLYRKWKKLLGVVDTILGELDKIARWKARIEICNSCGCFVHKGSAYGQDKIVEELVGFYPHGGNITEKKVQTYYYCKKCYNPDPHVNKKAVLSCIDIEIDLTLLEIEANKQSKTGTVLHIRVLEELRRLRARIESMATH